MNVDVVPSVCNEFIYSKFSVFKIEQVIENTYSYFLL